MEFKLPGDFEGVRIFSSEISDGPMNRLLGEGRRNIQKYLEKIAAVKPFASGGQPHKNLIEIIKKAGFYKNADGLLTKGPASTREGKPTRPDSMAKRARGGDYTLAVKTADCIPLLLYDKMTSVIGAIHISRNNLISGIIGKSLKKELEKLEANPLSVKIFLAPHIRWPHYEIKKDIYDQLRPTKWEKFIKSKNSKKYFDLTEAAIYELEGIGILKDNIYDSKKDTYLSDKFYSARGSRFERAERENNWHSRMNFPDFPIEVFLTVIFNK